MSDHYLKFSDEAAMLAALETAGVLVAADGGQAVPPYHQGAAIDVVGLVVDTPATIGDAGTITTQATYADGWHVNWRGDLPEALTAYEIDAPATPYRVWA